MKQIILSLIGVIFTYTTFAANCVSVKQISTDYTNHKITIALIRTGCTGDATNHRNTVWVFVDYRTVTGTTKGAWTRATVSATSAGTVVNSGNSKGAWIYSANGTQTVTLTLSGMPVKYDWCAFATDYPPNVAAFNNGTYTLRGTAPFLLNGNTTVNSTTYAGVAISSITDATGCPGIACGSRDANVGTGGCCLSGLTLVGGFCRDLVADSATIVSGIDAEVKLNVGGGCTAMGWRYPTTTEALTLHSRGWYVSALSSDSRYRAYCVHYAPNCSYCTFSGYFTNGYKCNRDGCQTWSICYNDNYSRCVR